MNVPSHEDVIKAIDAFKLRHPEIGDARIGRDATGEPGLVARLRRGSTPTLRVLERLKAYMVDKDGGLVHDETDTVSMPPASPDSSRQFIGRVSA